MANKGFTIRDELLLKFADLVMPPDKRGKLQMPGCDIEKTKNIANRRNVVEQAIGRVKKFKFLKNGISIACLHVLDEIVLICAAVCNMLPPLLS